ncbi:hypothetical protein I79_000780 [Cricetulus griseus]|uniref:Uncharacterized protein n=1 Tax=Cricetulus griseus TaxID=10029 RepID=G3GT07_CRIGR|nr:hypothetical protein I79_000780 [Cricetulus griseus]
MSATLPPVTMTFAPVLAIAFTCASMRLSSPLLKFISSSAVFISTVPWKTFKLSRKQFHIFGVQICKIMFYPII